MKKHFVTFYSPGTFVAEESQLPIDSWDVERAMKKASKITERYDATPYAFQFSTRERTDKDLDSKVVKLSGRYFLGGRVMTLAEVKKEMPDEKILISNMEGNRWDKIIVNTNSWKTIQVFEKDDVVLAYEPPKKKKAA